MANRAEYHIALSVLVSVGELGEHSGNDEFSARALQLKAQVMMIAGRGAEARHCVLRGLVVAEKIHDVPLMAATIQMLAKLN